MSFYSPPETPCPSDPLPICIQYRDPWSPSSNWSWWQASEHHCSISDLWVRLNNQAVFPCCAIFGCF